MRYLRAEEIKSAVFALAKQRGLLPCGVGRRRFEANITEYIKLPLYCRLIVAVLKQKGVDMAAMREKLLGVTSYVGTIEKRRKNGKK